MAEISFTKAQQKAIDERSCDVSVSAGAGSGKTAVLVSRFCGIVESGEAAVDEILTVTFTEKAAREMKERIIGRFEEKGLSDERRAVESAYIGTIHGFAARVLRENAFEAGVDPNFSVMAEAEAAAVSREVFVDIIDRRCRAGDADALELLETFGMVGLYDAVTALHQRLCSLGLRAGRVRVSESADASQAVGSLLEAARNVAAFDGRKTPTTDEKLARVRETLPELERILDLCLNDAGGFDWEAFAAMPEPTKLFPKSGVSSELKPLMDEGQQALKAARTELLDGPAKRLAERMLRFLEVYREHYEKEKRRTGRLDFDDLLLVTRDLFLPDGDPSPTAEWYRNKFRFISVDEFQDTNPLQKQIIDAIRRPGRLFTVGDVKQSIYRFNNSDVGVFLAHHESIALDGRITFQENFRSRPDILGFVNWIFGLMFREDGTPFEELIPGRGVCDGSEPDVELLMVRSEGGAQANRLTEARAICGRIRSVCGLDGKPALEIQEKDGTTRGVGFGDIVILLRATTNVGIYERALHEAGIPYYIVSGRGYFHTQEVRDVLNLLKLVENPLDDVVMAGVLRSPMVRLSDDALYWLSRDHSEAADRDDEDGFPTRNRNIGKLYEALKSEAAIERLSQEDREKARRFADLLSRLHAVRSEGRITDIIDRAMVETGYELAVLAMPNGKRRYANLKKLYEIAQGFQSGSLFGLSDFIGYIRELETIADREAEAPTESEGSGVVRVMTIHKAKGLEAPVIFVADTSRRSESRVPIFLVDRTGTFACKARDPYQDKWQNPASFEKLWSEAKTEDQRELRRLLYVAATRARDLLIFSGSSNLKGNHKDTYQECSSWLAALEKAMWIGPEVDDGDQLQPDGGVPVTVRIAAGDGAGPGIIRVEPLVRTYREEIMNGLPLPVNVSVGPSDQISPVQPRAESPSTRTPVYPVSRLLDYADCPKRYWLRHVVKAGEEEFEEEFSPGVDVEDRPDSASLGSRVHEILRAARFGENFASDVAMVAAECEPELREPAKAACLRLMNCRLYPEMCSAEKILREVPFRIKVAGVQIAGRIDLLYRFEGRWTIVDYKTGGNDLERRYRLQVGIYAAAVGKALGELPQRVALVPLGSAEYREESPTQADVDGVEALVAGLIREIDEGHFPRAASSRCAWCGYSGKLCIPEENTERTGL